MLTMLGDMAEEKDWALSVGWKSSFKSVSAPSMFILEVLPEPDIG